MGFERRVKRLRQARLVGVRATIAVAVSCVLLAGCSSSDDEQDLIKSNDKPVSTSEQVAKELAEAWKATQSTTAELRSMKQPKVATVRLISPDEYATVMAACLNSSGYPDAKVASDGGLEISIPTDAGVLAYRLADFTCQAKYPIDPKYNLPFTAAQLKALYEYFSGPLTKCLKDEGYTASKPTSLSEFREKYQSGNAWNPLNEVLATLGDPEKVAALQTACPSTPAGIYE